MKLHIWRVNAENEMELETVTVDSKTFQIVVESTEGIDEGEITILEDDEGYLMASVKNLDTYRG